MIPSPYICQVNVGGAQFTFSRTTFEQHHVQDSIISTTVLGKNSDIVPFFDVDPKLFEKWIAPYIRQEVLPTPVGLESPHDREHLIRAANTVGLIALAQYVEQKLGATKIKLPYCVFRSNHHDYLSGVKFFCNFVAETKIIGEIYCPDEACPTIFTVTDHFTLAIFLNHFRASPHNGTVTSYEESGTGHGINQYGIIECEMQNYKPFTIEGNNLVHKKEPE